MRTKIVEIADNTYIVNETKEVFIDAEGRCISKVELTPSEEKDLHDFLSKTLIQKYNEANN